MTECYAGDVPKERSSKAMTIRQLMFEANNLPLWTQLAALAIPPVFTLFCSLFHEREDGNLWPWKYVYSLIIFTVFIPCIFCVVIIGYSAFMVYENLLDANIIFVFGPIATMLLTTQIMKWNHVSINRLPGFSRLIGLVLLIGSASVGSIILFKSRIVVFASLSEMFQIMLLLLVIMYIGYYFLFCREESSDEE